MLVLEAKGIFIIALVETELDLWFWDFSIEFPAKQKFVENSLLEQYIVFKPLIKLLVTFKIKLEVDTIRYSQEKKAHLFQTHSFYSIWEMGFLHEDK